jgi:dihydropyrimidinase
MAETYDIVIRDGRVVTPDGVVEADLGIVGERIAAIGRRLPAGRRDLDAAGCFVMPGGVDPHAHIEQMSGMGVMNADTFETATASAAMGGTTSVISFAAQARGEALSATVADYAARAARGAMIDHAFHITVTDPDVPGFDSDLVALIGQGHRSIKVFTTYAIRLEDRAILDLMMTARKHGALVCVHAENHAMIGWTRDALLAAGKVAPRFHALSHPRLAEIEAVERICRMSEFTGAAVMVFHVSCAESLGVIAAAQARGVAVVAETCPHYLLSDETVLDRPGIEGAKWMCSPPQRTEADGEALLAALQSGLVQVVSSDHAPYRFDTGGKLAAGPDATFAQIANGLPGLETRLPLMFDAMVSNGAGGAELFAQVTATAPARIYGLERKGRLEEGLDADIAIWDPGMVRRFGADDLHDNAGYNPWQGYEVRGWPRLVLSRGAVIVDDGVLRADPGRGRWIRRDRIGVAPAGPAAEVLAAGGRNA